jgi:pantetheine-phosphate adenylyltransferase
MLNLKESYSTISWAAEAMHINTAAVIKLLQDFDKYPRVYHSSDHIVDLFEKIGRDGHDTDTERFLLITALFHDYVYDPKSQVNEAKSAEVFKEWAHTLPMESRLNTAEQNILMVYETIIDTKGHVPRTQFSETFCKYDLSGFADDAEGLVKNEMKIRKEYAWVDWDEYKVGKLKFLREYADTPIPKKDTRILSGIQWLYNYVSNEEAPNIGIYAGTFNPFHVGHKNILEQAEKIFDRVVIARGFNPEKPRGSWVVPEALKFHQTETYNTSLAEYFTKKSYNPTLIRGLRNATDLQAEINQLRWLQAVKPDLKVVYLIADKEYDHISSSGIRSVGEAMFEDLCRLAGEYEVK